MASEPQTPTLESSLRPRRSSRFKFLLFTLLILLLAAFLRFHNLDAQSLWNDEGNSARLSERSVQLILEGTASDIHPPFYYLLLRGWRELVGDSEFGLRSLSAFAGLVVVAGMLALGKVSFYDKPVLSSAEAGTRGQRDNGFLFTAVFLSALITAVSPPLIYYSQEARMYSLLALEATLSTLFFLWWWPEIGQKAEGRRQKRIAGFAIGYVIFATLGLYTHYSFPAVIVAQNGMFLILLIREWRLRNEFTVKKGGKDAKNLPHRRNLRKTSSIPQTVPLKSLLLSWCAMMLATFLLYLPWLPIFLGNIGGGPAERPFLPDFLRDVFRWLAFGSTISAAEAVAPLTAVFILIGLGLVLDRSWRTAVCLTALLIPILAAYYVGATEPQLFKMLLVSVIPFALLTTLVVFASRPGAPAARKQSSEAYFFFGKWRLQYMGLLVFLGLLVTLGIVQSLVNLYTNPDYARADYRGMAAQIAVDNHANVGIILNAPNQWEVFTYYHTSGAPVYPLPLAGMSREQVETQLADIAAKHDRLYVIYWGDGQQDPQRVVESWLDEHTYLATSDWEQDVRFVVYAVPAEPAADMAVPLNLPFGDHISLAGYTLANNQLTPGDIAQLTLFWQTDAPLEQRYKVFLHLLDENGQRVAQRDSEPGSALKPTTIWQPGETISDNHGLLIPADLPPGRYSLVLGLYDITDANTRLPSRTESGVLDALPLETIFISN